jgi:hypothetical protein
MLNKMIVLSAQSSSKSMMTIALACMITRILAKVVGALIATIVMNMSPRIGT